MYRLEAFLKRSIDIIIGQNVGCQPREGLRGIGISFRPCQSELKQLIKASQRYLFLLAFEASEGVNCLPLLFPVELFMERIRLTMI